MILTMTVTRTPSQHARATLRAWTIELGSYEVAFVQWDPSGPLSARVAAMQAMEQLLTALRVSHPEAVVAAQHQLPLA